MCIFGTITGKYEGKQVVFKSLGFYQCHIAEMILLWANAEYVLRDVCLVKNRTDAALLGREEDRAHFRAVYANPALETLYSPLPIPMRQDVYAIRHLIYLLGCPNLSFHLKENCWGCKQSQMQRHQIAIAIGALHLFG